MLTKVYNLPCSALQRSAVAFGETLPVPEIVVIGGQVSGLQCQLRRQTSQRASQHTWCCRDAELISAGD